MVAICDSLLQLAAVAENAYSQEASLIQILSQHLGTVLTLDDGQQHHNTFDEQPPAFASAARLRAPLPKVKNLYLRHRFFDEIRQIHSFFYVFSKSYRLLFKKSRREDSCAAPNFASLIVYQV